MESRRAGLIDRSVLISHPLLLVLASKGREHPQRDRRAEDFFPALIVGAHGLAAMSPKQPLAQRLEIGAGATEVLPFGG